MEGEAGEQQQAREAPLHGGVLELGVLREDVVVVVEKDAVGGRRVDTCVAACHMAGLVGGHRRVGSSPWVRRASSPLGALEASSCDGLFVPGEDPEGLDGEDLGAEGPGSRESSLPVGLR